jgi:hypothetical protein
MSSLKPIEKQYLEKLLEMSGGYVLKYSNRTFEEFFRESINVDIYTEKYNRDSGSKAQRLRAFWEQESDALVGKVLNGLLDVWEFENGQDITNKEYLKCRNIASRLLGKENINTNTVPDIFLKQEFKFNIEKLNLTSEIENIVKLRLQEIKNCLQPDTPAPLACILLCGSLLEVILLDLARSHAKEFNQSQCSPKCKWTGKVHEFHNWTLSDLIDVAHDKGFIGLDIKNYSHSLRNFRNYIHPHQQLLQKFNPDLEPTTKPMELTNFSTFWL